MEEEVSRINVTLVIKLMAVPGCGAWLAVVPGWLWCLAVVPGCGAWLWCHPNLAQCFGSVTSHSPRSDLLEHAITDLRVIVRGV
jgi:hypothetical protein